MAVDTEVANLSISHVGIGLPIQDLESDTTPEARACQTFLETTRKIVLRDFNWPFATKFLTLNQVEENPNQDYNYSYRYPTDCLDFRRILPLNNVLPDNLNLPGVAIGRRSRIENRQTRVPYRLGRDVEGRLIYTDMIDAVGEYTEDVDDLNQYPDDFIMAWSFRLAYYITPRIAKGDPYKIQQDLYRQYAIEISRAEANALNEEQADEEPDSEFIRGRE